MLSHCLLMALIPRLSIAALGRFATAFVLEE